MPSCEWCHKKDQAFEVVVYSLRTEESHVANVVGPKTSQLVRDKVYANIRVCDSCLPIVQQSDSMMGREPKKGK